MSTSAHVGSFIESKTSVVQTLNVGLTSEVPDYLEVHTGPGVYFGRYGYAHCTIVKEKIVVIKMMKI